MNDAEYERVKALIDRLVDVWQERLRLGYWGIHCYYYRSGAAFIREAPEGATKDTSAMCQSLWQYLTANLYFNVEKMVDTGDSEDWERIVIHEMTHAVVDELYHSGKAQDGNTEYEKDEWAAHNERVVTHLADSFYRIAHPKPVGGEY